MPDIVSTATDEERWSYRVFFQRSPSSGQGTLTGRSEGLTLERKGGQVVSIQKWGTEIIEKLRVIAGLLDSSIGNTMYGDSVEAQYRKIQNIDLLPSSQMIDEMKNNNESYLNFITHGYKDLELSTQILIKEA